MDERTEEIVIVNDKDYEQNAVPMKARKGFMSLFVVMLGFTFFSASMSVGARMGNGLSLNEFIAAIVIGGLILSLYTCSLSYVGSKTGFTIDLLARRAFGEKGSYLPSAMIALTQIGWFGVGVAMFTIPVSELLGVNHIMLAIVAGILMTSSAWWGYRALAIVSAISVPLISILGFISIGMALEGTGGMASIFSNSGGMSMTYAIGIVVGSFVSGGTATPNFVRYAKTPKTAVITTAIAFFLGNTLMFLFGAVGGAVTGADDIFYVMIAQGLLVPAVIVLGCNIWTTNDNALYSAGLGLSNITKNSKRHMTVLGGIIGTALSVWLYNNFVGWLSFLNCTLPPVGIIVVLDYFRHKELYKEGVVMPKSIRMGSVAGVIIGALVANFLPYGIASINAMVVATICYFISEVLENKEAK